MRTGGLVRLQGAYRDCTGRGVEGKRGPAAIEGAALVVG